MRTLLRYVAVSALALVADVLAYAALLAAGVMAGPAAAGGYAIGMAFHYIWSRRRVFGSVATGPAARREAAGFLASGLAGLALTTAVVHAATDAFGLHAGLAKGLAVGLSFFAVYAVRRLLVFRAAVA